MTKILLHGGYGDLWAGAGDDLPLYQRLIYAAKKYDNKIMIGFLSHEKLEKFPFIDQMKQSFENADPSIELVIADRSNFKKLLPDHKVLFLQGGNSLGHQKFLSNFSKEEILKNKMLLGGSSSGASLICEYGYTGSSDQPLKGKDILNIAVMPHANSWPIKDFVPKLRDKTNRPIILLKENELVEFNLD